MYLSTEPSPVIWWVDLDVNTPSFASLHYRYGSILCHLLPLHPGARLFSGSIRMPFIWSGLRRRRWSLLCKYGFLGSILVFLLFRRYVTNQYRPKSFSANLPQVVTRMKASLRPYSLIQMGMNFFVQTSPAFQTMSIRSPHGMRAISWRDAPFLLNNSNITGNEVLKRYMYSGDWIVIIEGYTFAWMRTFAINAGPQQTLTQTPTAIFNVTKTPVVTMSTTSTAQ